MTKITASAADAFDDASSPASTQPVSEDVEGREGLSRAEADVLAERRRHKAEGWTPEHDDQHLDGELAMAAACYAIPDGTQLPIKATVSIGPINRLLWPWSWEWWKPKDRRRDLVRAGALILAEIERLDRVAQAGGDQ